MAKDYKDMSRDELVTRLEVIDGILRAQREQVSKWSANVDKCVDNEDFELAGVFSHLWQTHDALLQQLGY